MPLTAMAERAADRREARITPRLKFLAGLIPLAIFFIVAGILHFAFPTPYLRIVPPFLPWPGMLVVVSGAAEIAGGVGLLLKASRRAAAYGLTLLLVAVFPANIYMALEHVNFPGLAGEAWVQWLRLPLQIPMILWVLYYAKDSVLPEGFDHGRQKR
jgi:uncharacterized membrane protein